MKNMKKILALVLALMLVLGMTAALATDPEPTGKTITLTGGKAGHTYTLYQIFTGKVDATNDQELTDIQWGNGIKAASRSTLGATAAAYAKDIATLNDARATAQSLVDGNHLENGTEQALNTDGNVQFSGLAEGYYVITDTNNNSDAVEGDYTSALIVKVVNDVNGAIKGSATTSDKKVADNNDTQRVQPDLSGIQDADWDDSADYDIGDYVPFKLTAHTAGNLSSYAKYHVTFQDKLGGGLTAPTSWTVTVLGKTFTLNATGEAPASQTTDNGTKITVTRGTPDQGMSFAVTVTLEQANPTKNANDEITSYLNAECNTQDIVVTYRSQLTADGIVYGNPGNPNEMYVKYSNNPEDKNDTEEGKTTTSTVIVLTYRTVVDKVDETGAALDGATFVLYKEVADGTANAQTGAAIKATYSDDAIKTAATALADAKNYIPVTATVSGTKNDRFTFSGIDDGTYVLVETVVPTGYNPWTATQFTVSATHDGNNGLTVLNADNLFHSSEQDGWVGDVELTKKNGTKYTTSDDEMYQEIENNSGSTLPSTGGIGTTIFYIAGSILVLAAVIFLVTKRRMGSEE